MLTAALLLSFGLLQSHTVTPDGAWCWFADPRGLWVDGKIVTGSVSSLGDVRVHVYDPLTRTAQDHVLAAKFEKDDHDNPALLRLPDGRLAAFWTKHTGRDMFLSTTTQGTGGWTEPVKINPNDPDYKGPQGAITTYTYPNPQILHEENDRIYLFWRGMNWKPTFSYSDDMGKTWSPGKILVSPRSDDPNNRPYTKVSGNGWRRIHVAFTDGHPRNEPTNSIYYVRYEQGALWAASGQRIASIDEVPITPEMADVVYDGKAEGVRAWIWDVASDWDGNPVVVYSRLPAEDRHEYRYAHWNGRRWVDRKITDAGKWFPQTPEGKREPEPHYSGGVVIDPHDPNFVYLSRPVNGKFQIERWFTLDGGDTWSRVALTRDSERDNVRPFVLRGATDGEAPPRALWMNVRKYVHYTDYETSLQGVDEDRGPFSPEDPMRTADAVFRWVQSNPSRYPKWEWMLAPLFSGVLAYGEHRKNPEAVQWVRDEGASNNYAMGPRKAMADDVAVGQAFLRLYQLDKDPRQLAPVKQWIDGFVAMPHTRPLLWVDSVHNEEMAWCDALYMAPPAMALLSVVTGDPRYVDTMSRLWWKTSDYLYDPEEHLYFRDSRYFAPREANGQKVFWSRGNGWVLAGLARVLTHLPTGHPDRHKFVTQFREMSSRLARLQTADGTWHASLLDPESYPVPETSGTGFFTYAMAWGINNGLLDRASFLPVVRRGFAALTRAVDPNGRLSYVQPVGQDPKTVKHSDTDSYGVGAFLLAACEVAKLGN